MSSYKTDLMRDHKVHAHCPMAYQLKMPPCCCAGHPCEMTGQMIVLDETGEISKNVDRWDKEQKAKKKKKE